MNEMSWSKNRTKLNMVHIPTRIFKSGWTVNRKSLEEKFRSKHFKEIIYMGIKRSEGTESLIKTAPQKEFSKSGKYEGKS